MFSKGEKKDNSGFYKMISVTSCPVCLKLEFKYQNCIVSLFKIVPLFVKLHYHKEVAQADTIFMIVEQVNFKNFHG